MIPLPTEVEECSQKSTLLYKRFILHANKEICRQNVFLFTENHIKICPC